VTANTFSDVFRKAIEVLNLEKKHGGNVNLSIAFCGDPSEAMLTMKHC